ncbi:anhydro-N-acetylmuramic acid kinase [Roseobacter cerasinus]|uniref:Anhydro-N-acetylmuramic acid kinase n=1 Tax=Roseobacter cerasinus TaxID=2602289 RepID=A0A640VXB6_9RHOB|nr:anhydro-N-acetylmuramic acid kinase [Roseobacter cerasinus]GFE51731.1 anhydro-N-acetylmuramic acid kinase [Roseobacter cerasinus]
MSRAIAKTGPVTAVGTMSGTSLDGVDSAVLVTDGHRIESFGPTSYRSYTDIEERVLRRALGKWSGTDVDAATEVVERAHLELLGAVEAADLIGFHGQTLAHAPRAQGTLQVGDGARLAEVLNRPVVWDFRSTDVALGGEGAPLAPFFHFACAKHIGADAPLAFLNLGGVGNLTYVDPRCGSPETPGALLAFDTGPANAPVNDLLQARRGLKYDKDGRIAAEGTGDQRVVEVFLAEPFFSRSPPKSLDRNDFANVSQQVADLSDADAAATLIAICAAGVAEGMRHCPAPPSHVLVTGGGRHNPVLMRMLADALECPISPVEQVGLDGDMLEAQAFAYLAVRVARGLPTSCPTTTGVSIATGGGTVSWPAETEALA